METSGQYSLTFRYLHANEVIALGTVLPGVCTIVTVLRLYTRRREGIVIGWDDYLILFGLFCLFGMAMSCVAGASLKAFGFPTPPPPSGLTDDQLELWVDPISVIAGKLEYVFQIFMILCYGAVKASITLYYHRIFVTGRRGIFDVLTKITLVIIALWTITFELIMILACGASVSANWAAPAVSFQDCNVLGFSGEYGFAVSDLILDLIVILMPLPIVWRLHLSTPKKFAVTGILLLGCSAIGASIARLAIYVEILQALYVQVVFDPDQQVTLAIYWSLLEAGLALIAACLPTLAHLGRGSGDALKRYVRSVTSQLTLRSSISSDRPGSHGNGQMTFGKDIHANTVTVKGGMLAGHDELTEDRVVKVETRVEVREA